MRCFTTQDASVAIDTYSYIIRSTTDQQSPSEVLVITTCDPQFACPITDTDLEGDTEATMPNEGIASEKR